MDHAPHHRCCGTKVHQVETDVVVLAVTSAHCLSIPQLWVAFGVEKNFRFLAALDMARTLGPDRCVALPMFMCSLGVIMFIWFVTVLVSFSCESDGNARIW